MEASGADQQRLDNAADRLKSRLSGVVAKRDQRQKDVRAFFFQLKTVSLKDQRQLHHATPDRL
jgi:hypothetical protein